MTPELEALARRAVACPRWRWMPGTLARGVMPPTLSWERLTAAERIGETRVPVLRDALPDLADPATIGCLLALVREAWAAGPDIESYVTRAGAPQVRVSVWAAGSWEDNDPSDFVEQTLAAALVAALEAAP